MYSLKGFITVSVLTDNTVGMIAPLGELSTKSLTYSREVGKYAHENTPNVELFSFSSKRDGVGLVPVSHEYAEHVLTIAQWIYERSIIGGFNQNQSNFIAAITAEFSSVAANFSCGQMVSYGTDQWLPEFVSWSGLGFIDPDSSDPEENHIRIWFSDQAFQAQYDEYEIVVIPPVDNLDSLFQDTSHVAPLLQSRTVSDLMYKIEEATEGDPYTYLRTLTFTWYDPFDDSSALPTNWTIAIYGAAGNNIDAIKLALTDYALENSSHPREDWLEILPDLFRVTEFIITPLWDSYAIPNQTLQAGIYSPVVKFSDMLGRVLETCVGYSEAHVRAALAQTNFVYKSIALLIVGGPENREGKFVITDMFSDYIAVPTTSHDFNRMSPRTQNWVMMMYDLLLEAEKATLYSNLPLGMTRVVRDGILYIVSSYEDVNYLVVAKSNYEIDD